MTTDILIGLNSKQREAVETIDGPLLIIAGPGSGKTRVITHRIAYMVRVCSVSPCHIAAVTFTNKAAREMRERLMPLLGHTTKNLTAGTFHSFCAMLLRREGEAIGLSRNFVIYDSDDQLTLIKNSMKDLEVDPKRFSPRAIQSAISSAKSQLLSVEGFALKCASYFDEITLRIYERYQQLLTQNSAADFDDLILKVHYLFEAYPNVASKYQNRYVHFMIDEFQDTNVAQYAIAQQLSQTFRNLCVVGDPDQSIYSWRNADVRNILSFQRDYPEAKVIALEENYRSTETILKAAEGLISSNTQRVEKDLWTRNGRGVPIVVGEGYNQEEEAQFVVKEIQKLTQDTDCQATPCHTLGQIAVMYRVNAQSRALEEACLRYGIPYQVIGGLKFYLRQEIKDLTAYLRLISNQNDDASLTRVINVPPRGIGQRTLDELIQMARDTETPMLSAIDILSLDRENPRGRASVITPRSSQALIRFVDLIKRLRADSEKLDLVGLIDLVLERTGYRNHLMAEADRGEERLDNIQEFRATAQRFVHLGLRDGLTAFLESVSLVSDTDSLEERPDTITLITMHQAKGLEFPVVFIVGMEEGMLPHLRSMDDSLQMEEERRLCYVGITRAKKRLYLFRAFRRSFRGNSGPSQPSRFLMDMPKDLIVAYRDRESESRNSPGQTPRNHLTVSTEIRRVGRLSPPRAYPSDYETENPQLGYPTFTTGDKVVHSKFGDGIVMSCEPSRDDFEVTVAFKDGKGVKRLLLSLAPMKKVE